MIFSPLRFLVVALLFVMSVGWPRTTQASGVISYGGDIIVRQFYDMSWEIHDRTRAFDPDLLPWPQLSLRLRSKIMELRVEVSEADVLWNGQPVLMLNTPYEPVPRILISKKKWIEAQNSQEWLRRTMVHELFISLGITDIDYSESRLFNQLYDLQKNFASISTMQFFILERKPWYVDWWYQTSLFIYLRQPYDPSFLSNLAARVDDIREVNLQTWNLILENFFSLYRDIGLCSDPQLKRHIQALDGYRALRRELHNVTKKKYEFYCRR